MTVLASSLLRRFSWIEHGFGTRDGPLSQEGMASHVQIHSSLALTAGGSTSESNGCVGEGDALITNRANVFVSVRTADCFPILLADNRNKVVAAVHAGWRGTAAGVSNQTFKENGGRFWHGAARHLRRNRTRNWAVLLCGRRGSRSPPCTLPGVLDSGWAH